MFLSKELTSSHCKHIAQRTAGLHFTTVGVDVNVSDRPLDPYADAQSLSGVSVQDVHKVCIVRGEALLLLHILEHRPCRV